MYQIFGIVGIFSGIGFKSFFRESVKLTKFIRVNTFPRVYRSQAKNFALPELFSILQFIREHSMLQLFLQTGQERVRMAKQVAKAP
jgi:hypothetical protein